MGNKQKIYNKDGELIAFNRTEKTIKMPPGTPYCDCISRCKAWYCYEPVFFLTKNKSWFKTKENREKFKSKFEHDV